LIFRLYKRGVFEEIEPYLRDRNSFIFSYSFSPLHFSAQSDHFAVVEFFVNHGADLNAQTSNVDKVFGRTPLLFSVHNDNFCVAQYLVHHGA